MLKKNDIIDRMAEKGYTKKDAGIIMNDFTDIMMQAMAQGESVQLYGFGTFEIKEHAAREVKNPKTGELISVPAYSAPKFKAGKLLKRAVREGYVREQ